MAAKKKSAAKNKVVKKCGTCRKQGHNARTCPKTCTAKTCS